MPTQDDKRQLNALSIDLEDYFHVSGFAKWITKKKWGGYLSRIDASTNFILDSLNKTNNKCTFFVLGWVANRHQNVIKKICNAGHEIGCHSYWHQVVYSQSPNSFQNDIRLSKKMIENITGARVNAFRAPSFSIDSNSLWALDVLIDEGFTIDSSVFPTTHDRYGISHSPTSPYRIIRSEGSIVEFPLSVFKINQLTIPVAGGGYFRIIPYCLTKVILASINNDSEAGNVYLHPWEFDNLQPRLQAEGLSRNRHYYNLSKTTLRFSRLLNDFAFDTLSKVAAATVS